MSPNLYHRTEVQLMLFLESKALNHAVDATRRTRLLRELQEQDMVPLIRSHRLRCFEDVLLGVDHVEEMEKIACCLNRIDDRRAICHRRSLLLRGLHSVSCLRGRRRTLCSRRNSLRSTHARTVQKARLVLPGRCRLCSFHTPILFRNGRRARLQCRRDSGRLSNDRTPICSTQACARRR